MKMNSPKATRVHLSIAKKKIEVLDFVKKTKFKFDKNVNTQCSTMPRHEDPTEPHLKPNVHDAIFFLMCSAP